MNDETDVERRFGARAAKQLVLCALAAFAGSLNAGCAKPVLQSPTVDGGGCSADCRPPEGMFVVTPPVVTFAATEGDAPPDPITVKVGLEDRGDAVLVGYAPGVAQPTWLSISDRPTTATTAEFVLQATDTSIVGDHATSVRLRSSHHSSAGFETFDLPVTYRVAPFELAVHATPEALAFTAGTGQTTVASQAVDVTFSGDDLVVISVPPWAAVSAPGDATSRARLEVSITDTSFAAGTVLSGDVVLGTARGTSQRTTRVHVTYEVVAPPALAIEAAPDTLAFTAFHGGSVPPSQDVTITFQGDTLSVVAMPSWITVSPTGSSTSPVSLAVSVNDTSLAGGTSHAGDILVRTTRGGDQSFASVHVDYDVSVAPEVQFVAPYVGIAGRPGTLRLRGVGFRATSALATVAIGDLRIGPVVADGDTQITVSYPALPAGRYPVTIVDPPGIAPLAPELVIIAPPAFGYQAIDAPSPRARILYDAERQAIYGVNQLDQQIEHFVYADGAWSTRSPHVIPLLADVAMAPNGRSLIVIDPDHVSEMSLTDDLFVPIVRRENPASYIGGFCDQAAAADNGKFLLRFGSSCTFSFVYDMLNRFLDGGAQLDGYPPLVAASADGSRIYSASAYQVSPQSVQIFESLSNVTQYVGVNLYMRAITVSGDASRVILDHTLVHTRALTHIGNIPAGGVTLASRDASRAFVYLQDATGPRLEIYDLNGPLQPGAVYPLLERVILRDSANDDGPYGVAMTTSLDDTAVFISGNRRLLVVPVD